MQKIFAILVCTGLLGGMMVTPALAHLAQGTWHVSQNGNILEISYGTSADSPQYAALHLDSSYFRMIDAPTAIWGTSVVLLPAFWSGGIYYQGAPITADWIIAGDDLVISIDGTIDDLSVAVQLRLFPPGRRILKAHLSTQVDGDVILDPRPGEAFKLVMLSSMHISPTEWDAQESYAGCYSYSIPESGWIIQPPRSSRWFGLRGGTSDWKTNAPTIEIALDNPRPVTGWVTSSVDPNDDNVAFWAATDRVLKSWSYDISAFPGPLRSLECRP